MTKISFMMRIYLSNIHDAWSFDRQEILLDRAFPNWRGMSVYRDQLSSAALKRGDKLVQRDNVLLRSTQPSDTNTVIVAALPVLARTPSDLTSVLFRLAARNNTLQTIAENVFVDPASVDIDDLKLVFQKAVRRFSEAGVAGGVASGKKRSAEAEEKIKLVEPFWKLLEPSSSELSRRFGVSRPTMIAKLGPRREAQEKYCNDLRRQVHALQIAEANRRRKKRFNKEMDMNDE